MRAAQYKVLRPGLSTHPRPVPGSPVLEGQRGLYAEPMARDKTRNVTGGYGPLCLGRVSEGIWLTHGRGSPAALLHTHRYSPTHTALQLPPRTSSHFSTTRDQPSDWRWGQKTTSSNLQIPVGHRRTD